MEKSASRTNAATSFILILSTFSLCCGSSQPATICNPLTASNANKNICHLSGKNIIRCSNIFFKTSVQRERKALFKLKQNLKAEKTWYAGLTRLLAAIRGGFPLQGGKMLQKWCHLAKIISVVTNNSQNCDFRLRIYIFLAPLLGLRSKLSVLVTSLSLPL